MLLTLLVQAAAPMAMQMPPASCPALAPLPAAWVNFIDGVPVTAAAAVDGADAATLPIGRGAKVALLPAASLTLPVALQRPLTAAQHGGLVGFVVPAAGRYRVALGRGVWIDVVQNGTALPSVAHEHGPDCTVVRKVVEWDLKPGRYLLQIAGDEAPSVEIGVFRANGLKAG